MPEYSSTNITPADGVQTPAMNGSTSGNYTLSALRDFILASKGQANGLATLDENGKLSLSQLPDLADDVIVVASYAVLPATGTAGKLYITADNNKGYRWDPDLATPAYVLLFNPADIDTLLSIISGAQVVGKAAADGNGNNIVDTYATKTALQEYETTNDLRVAANSQDIQNIQNALSGTVIQEHIDSTQKNVKSILSADELLPWAILKRVGARSTQFNQLASLDGISTQSDNGVTFTVNNDGSYTISGTASGRVSTPSNVLKRFNAIANHKYLITLSKSIGPLYLRIADSFSVLLSQTSFITTCTANVSSYIWFDSTENISGQSCELGKVNINIFDLTAMGLDSLTVDQFRALFPASYYAPSAGDIYDVPPLSFLYRGTNQWSEEWEEGIIYSNGSLSPAGTTGIRSKYFNRCLPSTQYYLVSSSTAFVIFYDSDYNFILREGNGNSITAPVNAFYFKISTATDYGTTYNHDIMFCLNSVTDKTYKPFIGQTIDTSFMAGKKYVNSSCYDYAENVYVNGILKRKNQTVVGMIELDGSLDESYSALSSERYIFSVADFISPATTVVANILCNRLITVDKSHVEQGNYQISGMDANAHEMMIHITSAITNVSALRTWLSQNPLKIYFELDTLPDPTYGDPIPNIPCEDGSTIMANTPQTEIVNAIDVPSTIGYSTKIA